MRLHHVPSSFLLFFSTKFDKSDGDSTYDPIVFAVQIDKNDKGATLEVAFITGRLSAMAWSGSGSNRRKFAVAGNTNPDLLHVRFLVYRHILRDFLHSSAARPPKKSCKQKLSCSKHSTRQSVRFPKTREPVLYGAPNRN